MWLTKRVLEEAGVTSPPPTHTQSYHGCVGILRRGEVAQRVDCWPTIEEVLGSVPSTAGIGHGDAHLSWRIMSSRLYIGLGYIVNSGAAWDT